MKQLPGGPPWAARQAVRYRLHLPELMEAIHENNTPSVVPYLQSNRQQISEHCAQRHSSDCRCPIDYLAVLLVQVLTVDQHRAAGAGA